MPTLVIRVRRASSLPSILGAMLFFGMFASPSDASLLPPVSAGAMTFAREDFTLTLLLDGRVLAVGGNGPSAPTTVEIFDPRIGRWRVTTPVSAPRANHSATLLRNGDVLVVGGGVSEIFDPRTETWRAASSPQGSRGAHTATRLNDGRVLVVGGGLPDAEVFDPEVGTQGAWFTTGPTQVDRSQHTAVLLPDGRVFITGAGSAEVFDPDGNQFILAAPPPVGRNSATATRLASGEILVAGGYPLDELETMLYDPATDLWRLTAPIPSGRGIHTATLLASGEVLLAGGDNGRGTYEIFDPETESWAPTETLIFERRRHASVLLASGSVLIVGGRSGSGTTSLSEVMNPRPGGVRAAGPMVDARSRHRATMVSPTGRVLLTGGFAGNGSAPTVLNAEQWDPVSDTATPAGATREVSGEHASATLPDGRVLVTGGGFAETFDPIEGWQPAVEIETTGDQYAQLLPSGKVLVAGMSSYQVFDPESGIWSAERALPTARRRTTATLLESGKVLVAGGFQSTVLGVAELYDPVADAWTLTGNLAVPRQRHVAALLPSGEVLVAGGQGESRLDIVEVYDPEAGVWRPMPPLHEARARPAATVLSSGEVIVLGGTGSDGAELTSVERFDPISRDWQRLAPLMAARSHHTATALPNGEILVAGGEDDANLPVTGIEIYQPRPVDTNRRPVITQTSASLDFGTPPFLVTGTGFIAPSEGGGGRSSTGENQLPHVRLQSLSNDRVVNLALGPLEDTTPRVARTLRIEPLPTNLDPGWYRLSVSSGGITSTSRLVPVPCGLEIDRQPSNTVGELGTRVTFSVSASNARRYQWFRDDTAILGATGPSFTTQPLVPADANARYHVTVENDCKTVESQSVTLGIVDDEAPNGAILEPNGGELWQLSLEGQTPNQELIAWAMNDNLWICRVEVRLLASSNGGPPFLPIEGNSLIGVAGDAPGCTFPGIDTTALIYDMPSTPPGGSFGLLYKIQIRLFDHAGLTTDLESEQPFSIFEDVPNNVRTLILHHSARLEAEADLGGNQPGLAFDELHRKLRQLAAHPKVQGVVIDLANDPALNARYADWDNDRNDPDLANQVLFGTRLGNVDQPGLHDRLLELLETFSEVRYVVLVGDDRIIPMARIEDGTVLFPESRYPDNPDEPDLTSEFQVGASLAADLFLSDDPLGLREPIETSDLIGTLLVPDLVIGRLVETAPEMIGTINRFLSRDGTVSLVNDGMDDHRVQITGYDFLLDGAQRVRDRWNAAFGLDGADGVGIIDADLVAPNWPQPAPSTLRGHLCGNGGAPYRIINLNGHATHYEEGVPGGSFQVIEGLETRRIDAPEACGLDRPLDLEGAVVYAVGCHGGLTVPGSDPDSPDHELDLPQTLMRRGALGYVANTGYGWGLLSGVGYSERLIEVFTEEMTSADTVTFGDAVLAAKTRYWLETPRIDPYDVKTLMQWALFGLPMVSIETGIDNGTTRSGGGIPARPTDRIDGVGHERQPSGMDMLPELGKDADILPPFMTRAEHRFDLSAEGVYTKRDALGAALPDGPGDEGCPETGSDGCYYTFNGLATGETDLPILPYFVFDSRISATSQHGVLWMGSSFVQQTGWRPVIGELSSNGGDGSDHGVAPKTIVIKPTANNVAPGRNTRICRPSDADLLNSITVTTGEVLAAGPDDPELSIERHAESVTIEALYFNNTVNGEGNCDRQGPRLGAPPFEGAFHRRVGSSIEWSVPATDEAGVWRVVVVYDATPLSARDGAWIPIDLSRDDDGTWRGGLSTIGFERLVYVIQAVDNRGNVSWLDFVATEMAAAGTPDSGLPSSGVPLALPLPVEVALTPGVADLAIDLVDEPDPAHVGGILTYRASVQNLGPDPASDVTVTMMLPESVFLETVDGEEWSCMALDSIGCHRARLEVGESASVVALVRAPLEAGMTEVSARVSTRDEDLVGENDLATVMTATIDEFSADLTIVKSDGGVPAVAGEPIQYSLVVSNNGPGAILGARVVDDFPTEIHDVSWSCTTSLGASCGPSGFGDIDEQIDLPAGGIALFLATGIVDGAATGPIVNEATVTAPAPSFDPDPANNLDRQVTSVFGPELIFADGFESGHLSAWSATVPAPAGATVLLQPEPSTDRFRAHGILTTAGDQVEGTFRLVDATTGTLLALVAVVPRPTAEHRAGHEIVITTLEKRSGRSIRFGGGLLPRTPRLITLEMPIVASDRPPRFIIDGTEIPTRNSTDD